MDGQASDAKKVYSNEEMEESKPWFIQKGRLRDKNKRQPSNPDYDPTTLYIPPSEWENFTPTMKQFWKIKSSHYDKIIFFKSGKFYEIFYDDAIICQRVLDLNWMNSHKKLHVGFPEKNKEKYASMLVSQGYQIAVVEQIDSSQSRKDNQSQSGMSQKIPMLKGLNKKYNQKECCDRDIIEMYSKGTLTDQNRDNYEPNYVMAIKMQGTRFGVCFFDVSIHKCHIGQFDDDTAYQMMRTTLTQIRPSEVIVERNLLPKEIEKMIKHSPISPTFKIYSGEQCISASRTVSLVDRYLFENKKTCDEIPLLLKLKNDPDKNISLEAFGMAIKFLEEHLIAESQIKFFDFIEFEPMSMKYRREFMVLDSQAIEHLEIVEFQSGQAHQQASLFQFIDQTKTAFGKRLLKKWLLAPLLDIPKINERLDSVEDLARDQELLEKFRMRIAKLPDLERILSKVFTYSVKNRNTAIYFENVSFTKLREFKSLLRNFKEIRNILAPLVQMHSESPFKSQRLLKLITIGENGLMPSLGEAISEFEFLIVWKKVSGGDDDIPEPREGLDKNFDDLNIKVNKQKKELEEFLGAVKLKFSKIHNGKHSNLVNQIAYSHSRLRYEIEIPQELVQGKNKPHDFELTSNRAGFQRFMTQPLKDAIERLEMAEDELKEAITPFVCALFQRFYDNRHLWLPAVTVLSELDCLQSLAMVSASQSAVMCRPQFIPYKGKFKKKAYLEIRQLRHPCVNLKTDLRVDQIKNFIPNDTVIDTSKGNNVLLVTGPNMGGKSTLLRQTCLGVVLAQIGSYVPAESCILTPVDRIFTRLGASDRILEGKSTFFVEMEETNTILNFATFKSLAIVDELGRGTSTFDGYSIAQAVLNYLINKVHCRSLFSTHYHMLLEQFRNVKGVESYHMACRIRDNEQDRITFLYKFIKGECG